jgi:hypothetical protein
MKELSFEKMEDVKGGYCFFAIPKLFLAAATPVFLYGAILTAAGCWYS